MKKTNASHGIIASGGIITILEVSIQLCNFEPATSNALASLAPIFGGAIAWCGNRAFVYYSLPEKLLEEDAMLAQGLKMLKKDVKCPYTPDEKKEEIRIKIAETKEARRKLRLEAAAALSQ